MLSWETKNLLQFWSKSSKEGSISLEFGKVWAVSTDLFQDNTLRTNSQEDLWTLREWWTQSSFLDTKMQLIPKLRQECVKNTKKKMFKLSANQDLWKKRTCHKCSLFSNSNKPSMTSNWSWAKPSWKTTWWTKELSTPQFLNNRTRSLISYLFMSLRELSLSLFQHPSMESLLDHKW